jgi:hypothetical protein
MLSKWFPKFSNKNMWSFPSSSGRFKTVEKNLKTENERKKRKS